MSPRNFTVHFLEEKTKKNRRVQAGLGKYILYVRKEYYMDCRKARQNGTCKASYFNIPRRAVRLDTMQIAKANSKVAILGPHNERRLRLVDMQPIPRKTEILWNYGGLNAI